jgi:hypothetical protein
MLEAMSQQKAHSDAEFDVTDDEQADYQGATSFHRPVAELQNTLGLTPHALSKEADSPARSTNLSRRRTTSHLRDQLLFSRRLRVGQVTISFPDEAVCERYIDAFMADINPCHPCVADVSFRSRSRDVLQQPRINSGESYFMALHYIIFALVDILSCTKDAAQLGQIPGWHWYALSEDLIGRRKLSGRGGVDLIQLLVFEVCHR